MDARIKQWIDLILRYRAIVGLVTFILTLWCGVGLTKLSFDSDYHMFFDSDNPQLAVLDEIQAKYNKNDTLVFVVTDKSGEIFTEATLSAIHELTDAAWRRTYVRRVDSITNYQNTYADGDDLIVEDLISRSKFSYAEKREAAKAIALEQPELVNRILNPTASVSGVVLTYAFPGVDRAKEIPLAAEEARLLKHTIEAKYPQIELRMAGVVVVNDAFVKASKKDLATLIPLCFLVVVLGIFFYTRSVFATATAFLVIVVSIVCAMGLAGWWGITVTPPLMSGPIMIMTLAVADCIHIIACARHEAGKGRFGIAMSREAIIQNLNPVILTSVTTIVGFLSFNFSDSPPFRDLGNVVSLGVFFAMVLSLTVLPCCLSLLRLRPPAGKSNSHFFQGVHWVVRTYHTRIVLLFIPIVGLGIAAIFLNETNDIFSDYFDKSMTVRQDTDYTLKNLTGSNTIQYSIPAEEEGGINDLLYLENLDNMVAYLRQQKEVVHVASYIDVVKKVNRTMHGNAQAFYAIPDSRELASQLMVMYELSLPYGLDMNNMIDVGKSATRLIVTLTKLSSRETIDFEARLNDWVVQNLPKSMHARGSSGHVVFAHIGQSNIHNMLSGSVYALLLISVLVGLALRSFKLGLLSLLPNIFPAALAFGVWGVVNGQVGLGLSVVAGMSLGIVVDFTIHFLSKFQRAQKLEPLNIWEAVHFAYTTVGSAITVTAVILVAGFSILAMSPFAMNAEMGLLTAVTIVFAFIINLFFLPSLLLVINGGLPDKQQPLASGSKESVQRHDVIDVTGL